MMKQYRTSVLTLLAQAGIGTYTTPQIATPMMAKISKTLDEAVAWNLDHHVMGTDMFILMLFEHIAERLLRRL